MVFKEDFHKTGRIVKGGNSSFVTLIPNKSDDIQLSEHRPISLIGCMYKIMIKVLANRLASVMDSVISENQAAFMGKRQILDILVLNEVVDFVKKNKKMSFIFKANFEKPYDSVMWEYLDKMM